MTAELNYRRKRFDALLAGISAAPYDQPLLERDDWLVAPTLGSIIPNWLLAIPRHPTLSFRDWVAEGRHSTGAILAEIQMLLGISADDLIWFEHGPARIGTVVGCGLDHAHLHILIQPAFDFTTFADCARATADVRWHETTAVESYANLADGSSYCVAGSGDRAIYANDVEVAGSQFFRRVVAKLAENAEWDYRQHSHAKNIEATIANFRRLERAAKVER